MRNFLNKGLVFAVLLGLPCCLPAQEAKIIETVVKSSGKKIFRPSSVLSRIRKIPSQVPPLPKLIVNKPIQWENFHPVHAQAATNGAQRPVDPMTLKRSVSRGIAAAQTHAYELLKQERKFLLEAYGPQAISQAITRKNFELANYMILQGDPISDEALLDARDSGNMDIFTALVNKKGSTRATLLASWKHPQLIASLLQRPTFIDGEVFMPGQVNPKPVSKTDQRGTLLIFSVLGAHPKSVELMCEFFHPGPEILAQMLHQAQSLSKEERVSLISTLVERFGADPTPLIYEAVKEGRYEDIVPFKQLGADVNFSGSYGNTALHLLASRMPSQRRKGDYIQTVQTLLENGADPTILNDDGKTPLQQMQAHLQERSSYASEWEPVLQRAVSLLEEASR